MRIENVQGYRLLQKDDYSQVNISNDQIIKYSGIYYKKIDEIDDFAEISTLFVGIVECEKFTHYNGIIGIFVKPLYIWSKKESEWLKIIDLQPPTYKYFLYPHLLMIPEHTHYNKPIYTLHTCTNISLEDFAHITNTFNLYL
jgi:hypothetical protein